MKDVHSCIIILVLKLKVRKDEMPSIENDQNIWNSMRFKCRLSFFVLVAKLKVYFICSIT